MIVTDSRQQNPRHSIDNCRLRRHFALCGFSSTLHIKGNVFRVLGKVSKYCSGTGWMTIARGWSRCYWLLKVDEIWGTEVMKKWFQFFWTIKERIRQYIRAPSNLIIIKFDQYYIPFKISVNLHTYRDLLFIYSFFPSLSSLSQLLRTFPITSAINPTNHLLYMPPKSMLIIRLIQTISPSCQPPRAVATNAKSICYNALHTRSWVKLKSLWRDCRTLWRLAETLDSVDCLI